jgi:ABC-type transport system substrate-binding protein
MNKSRLVAVLLLLVVFCAGGLVPAAAQGKTELVFGINTFVDSLDPGVTTSSDVGLILQHVVDTLVWQYPLGTFHPGLANDWSVNED